MPVGAGISASFGIADETTVGVPVPVTRFYEFESETLAAKHHFVQGTGLRQGGLVERASRRQLVAREAGGDVTLNATTNGLGLLLRHMLGSYTATPVSVGGGLYRQVHTVGPLTGHSFTTQVVRPDTSGVLAQQAFTYPGCKITDWDFSAAQNGQVKLKVVIDALDEATPSNAFAVTVLTAPVTAGATTISTTASIPAGSYIVLDTGVNEEVVQTVGAPTGSGPYVSTLTTPAKLAHATGVYVGSATGVNYGAAAAFQTASYNAQTTEFVFNSGGLVAGGSTATTGGMFVNTGGTTVANVRTMTVAGKNAVKADRWGLGTQIRSEQIDNGWRAYTADVEVEYNGRAFYDAATTDAPLCLVLTFTSLANPAVALSIYAPVGFQNDGGQPNVAGPDIITQKMKFSLLDDGANGALQIVYTSTDSTV